MCVWVCVGVVLDYVLVCVQYAASDGGVSQLPPGSNLTSVIETFICQFYHIYLGQHVTVIASQLDRLPGQNVDLSIWSLHVLILSVHGFPPTTLVTFLSPKNMHV